MKYLLKTSYVMMLQARNNSLTVLDAISALKTLSGTNVSIDTAVIGIAHSAAINAFGITPANVQLSNGQCCILSLSHPVPCLVLAKACQAAQFRHARLHSSGMTQAEHLEYNKVP